MLSLCSDATALMLMRLIFSPVPINIERQMWFEKFKTKFRKDKDYLTRPSSMM